MVQKMIAFIPSITVKRGKNYFIWQGIQIQRAGFTGALFVIIKNPDGIFETEFLENADDIDSFLSDFSVSATQEDLLRLLDLSRLAVAEDEKLRLEINQFISHLQETFPGTTEMSEAARKIENDAKQDLQDIEKNPDDMLLSWIDVEYELFRALEQDRYSNVLEHGFTDLDEFLEIAKQILNRRKSRAGKSLEHHLAEIFEGNHLLFEEQVVTEGNKKPDFIFPSGSAYHDRDFPVEKLVMLASKTTCKDRWRQVINEADRLKSQKKYLFTLQQGISENQMNEMAAENVVLVVPKKYISSFPPKARKSIMSLQQFINMVRNIEKEFVQQNQD